MYCSPKISFLLIKKRHPKKAFANQQSLNVDVNDVTRTFGRW